MKSLIIFTLLLALLACSESPPAAETTAASSIEPSSTEVMQVAPRWDKGGMVTAANPYAVEAAITMLENGGHAVDAAIAAHAVLGLVEPQSSGLGGGGFMLVFQETDNSMSFFDGRETAPAGATVDMFMKDGAVMPFFEAWLSGKSTGVPSTVALYKAAHDKFGKLPWADLFQPAIDLAANGFNVPERLASNLPRMAQLSAIDETPASANYLFPNGKAVEVGDLLVNPDYAATLTRIANEGPAAFYTGEIAADIVAVAQAEPNGGALTVADMAAYEIKERTPACGAYMTYTICSAAPPSSGAAVIEMAALYEHLAVDAVDLTSKVAAFVDAQRLAYADRDYYFGDPDRVAIPVEGILNPDYIELRATERIAPNGNAVQGNPLPFEPSSMTVHWGADTTNEVAGTTHLSIVDSDGNAVSMTASVESVFGSNRFVHGFFLNNQMTDFAREVSADGSLPANAVAPGARPRSSMSPTIILDENNDLFMVTGSPGGNSILAYNFKTIVGVTDWGMTAQESADFPNIIARGNTVRVETGMTPGKELAESLAAMGYNVDERDGENSGLHVIVVREDGLEGAADIRREGIVRTVP